MKISTKLSVAYEDDEIGLPGEDAFAGPGSDRAMDAQPLAGGADHLVSMLRAQHDLLAVETAAEPDAMAAPRKPRRRRRPAEDTIATAGRPRSDGRRREMDALLLASLLLGNGAPDASAPGLEGMTAGDSSLTSRPDTNPLLPESAITPLPPMEGGPGGTGSGPGSGAGIVRTGPGSGSGESLLSAATSLSLGALSLTPPAPPPAAVAAFGAFSAPLGSGGGAPPLASDGSSTDHSAASSGPQSVPDRPSLPGEPASALPPSRDDSSRGTAADSPPVPTPAPTLSGTAGSGTANGGTTTGSPPPPPAPAFHFAPGVSLEETGGQPIVTAFGPALDGQDSLFVTVSDGQLVSATLSLASEGVFSGLHATDGAPIHLFTDGAHQVVGRTPAGRVIMILSSTDMGRLRVSLLAPVQHGAPHSATDEVVSLDSGVLRLDVTSRDADGQLHHGDIDVGSRISIQDSTFQLPSAANGVVPPPEEGVTIQFDTQQVPPGFLYVDDGQGMLRIYQNQQGVDVLVREVRWNNDRLAVSDIAPIITPQGQGLQNLSFDIHYDLVDGDGDRLAGLATLDIVDHLPDPRAVSHAMSNRAVAETLRGQAFASEDGVATLQWLTGGAPQGTTYVIDPGDPSGLTLLVQQGGVTRIVARLDAATGDYTITRIAPLEHGALQSLILDLSYDLTDRDGDTSRGSISLDVADTVPLLTNPTLSIQERFGAQTVTAQAFSAPDGLQSATWTLPATNPTGFQYALDPADASGGTLIVRQLQNNIWVTIMGLVLDRQTGGIRATQVAPLLEDGSNGGQSILSFDYGVRDTDGDRTTGTVTVQVDRLGIVARNITVSSTETDTLQHLQMRAFTPSANLSDALWLTTGAPQGFSYQADPADASGRTLLIRQGTLVVATLVIDEATGNIIVEHDAAFAHLAGNGANIQSFNIGYRLSDANGGRQDYQLRFSITDSTPQVETVNIAFAESDQTRVLRGDAFSAVDGIQSARWQTGGAPPGVTYVLDPSDPAGTTLLIQQGGVTRMVAVLDRNTGTYALTTQRVLDHQGQNLVFDLAYDVTDGDGDRMTGYLVFTVEDSAPFVTATNITIAETFIGTRYMIGRATASDGIAGVTWSTTGAPAGFLYRANGNELSVRQVQNGVEVTVMTFSYDSATGQISAINRAAIDHLADGLSQRFTATINVIDRDGTTTRALVSTTVTDSRPSLPMLSNLPSTLMDGQTHDGRWIGNTSADRSVLEIEIGTQIRRLDLSSPTNEVTFTDNGLTYTFRADGTYRIVCDPTRDFTLQMTLRLRDNDGDVATQQFNRPVEFVNTAPVAYNSGYDVLTRADFVLGLSDFDFADMDGNLLHHVTLVDPINNGAMFLLNGVQIGAGTMISASDIANGNLVIRFPAGMNVGSIYAASFTVTDNGGTDHGGADTSGRMMLTFGVPYTWQDSGSSGNDIYSGGIPEDTYFGYGGNDTISGGEGNDTLYGGTGDDVIYGNAGNDRLFGEDGNDELRGGDGVDQISGGNNDDTIYGNGGDDVITGDSGNDVIYGGSGNDDLTGGTGADTIWGGTGNDHIEGGIGDDRLYGESGDNDLFGQDGNDYLTGGSGRNVLSGGAGDDVLFGGSGFTLFQGGSGADRFVIDAGRLGTGYDQIQDYSAAEGDIIDLSMLFTADLGTRFLERDGYVESSTANVRGYYVLRVSPNHDGRFYDIAVVLGDTGDEQVRVAFKDASGLIVYDWI